MEEISTAFGALSGRAAATAGTDPLDRICVRDYLRSVEIGAFQSERGVDQRIRFNVVLEVSHHNAASSDDVDKVISYDTIVEAIDLQLSTERINLLETLAERVAERCLEDPRAVRVFVRIEKMDRIPGTLGVEIVRNSKDHFDAIHPVSVPHVNEVKHPVVVFLANEVVHGPNLGAWLDAIAAYDLPAIICVDRPEIAPPRAQVSMAQRRIDLLAMEQNAWVLAGKDKRCVVVDSRTELDWAVKHDQLSVWAPSKMVLDAVESPEIRSTEGLALWLASGFQADRLVLVGAKEQIESDEVKVLQVAINAPVKL